MMAAAGAGAGAPGGVSTRVVRMQDVALAGQRVLIREDLNVPVKDGSVTSDARIRAALPTIRQALAAGARVLVMSHLGRPEEGKPAAEFSLAPVAARLSDTVFTLSSYPVCVCITYQRLAISSHFPH